MHASTIHGGEELSSYPGCCVVGLERRTLPGESVDQLERELEALLDACRAADPDLEAELRTLLVRQPFEVGEDAEIVALLRAAATEALGEPPKIAGASYWADSAFIAAAGIPTAVFGPAGAGAHATEEWVSLTSTDAVTRTLIELATRLCG